MLSWCCCCCLAPVEIVRVEDDYRLEFAAAAAVDKHADTDCGSVSGMLQSVVLVDWEDAHRGDAWPMTAEPHDG